MSFLDILVLHQVGPRSELSHSKQKPGLAKGAGELGEHREWPQRAQLVAAYPPPLVEVPFHKWVLSTEHQLCTGAFYLLKNSF